AMSSKPEISSPRKLARPDSDCSMASLSPAPKHIIALTPADLDVENPALVDFVRFARHVIDQNDPLKAAKYAGMLYLALISVFEADAMIEYEWAPSLTLEIQSIEYEIQLSSHRDVQSKGLCAGRARMSSRSELHADEKPRLRTRAIEGLLQRIVKAPINSLSPRTEGREDRITVAQDLLRVRDWAQLSAEPCGALISLLDKVDLLERKGVELSRATNWTYWSLGCAYRAFCEVRDLFDRLPDTQLHEGDKAWRDRTEQSRLFSTLCDSEGVRDKVESKRGRNALQKRLLRARKYVHLVDVLGEAVLDAVPVISISNLNQVSLEQIRLLPRSSADKALVDAVRERCAR
ncbi:hypothetical protein DB88DRAFT_502825, partial [Papiliotrema laurentii]